MINTQKLKGRNRTINGGTLDEGHDKKSKPAGSKKENFEIKNRCVVKPRKKGVIPSDPDWPIHQRKDLVRKSVSNNERRGQHSLMMYSNDVNDVMEEAHQGLTGGHVGVDATARN
ncbi:hypothetical protein H0E87_022958 [Populus deltoides]|uniref:Uncharacterized protein n=1 Tax=Populus deltoides TaxID=3696 RepID=A0A8T2XBY7_POPDE|nr:hypothetical protein H0E87_022958 [Populus deltoides]